MTEVTVKPVLVDATRYDFGSRIKRFIVQLVQFVNSLPRDQASRVIGDQLLRSGTSIGANYFEARSASSRKDYTNYFNHSLKSANETMFWLDILLEVDGNRETGRVLHDEAMQLAKIFASSILTLKGKRPSPQV